MITISDKMIKNIICKSVGNFPINDKSDMPDELFEIIQNHCNYVYSNVKAELIKQTIKEGLQTEKNRDYLTHVKTHYEKQKKIYNLYKDGVKAKSLAMSFDLSVCRIHQIILKIDSLKKSKGSQSPYWRLVKDDMNAGKI